MEKVTNPDYTPRQVANAIFGHSKFAPNQSMPLVIDRLKKNLPEDQYNEVVGLLKDAVISATLALGGAFFSALRTSGRSLPRDN